MVFILQRATLLAIAVLLASSQIQVVEGGRRRRRGVSTCNGGGGDKCGSDFSTYECGEDSKCCHDDFNAWCCPSGPWECKSSFAGGNDHCDQKKSCKCTDTTYYMTKIEAQSDNPKVDYALAFELFECCEPSTGTDCGWPYGTSVSWTQKQTVSWSNSVTGSLTVSAKEGLVVEGISASITVSDTYTNGETRETDTSLTVASQCSGTYTDLTHLNFTAQVAMYEYPVTITFTECGVESTTSGTVKSSSFIGNYNCGVTSCTTAPKTSCSDEQGCVADRRLHDIFV